ncbi:MFS transporter [Megasphaera paucivorans]|jgi:sugar phosphate permease|uniref:Sugar phosphate permease n=1 Tax=Megasphaera paucivorans TaxID=349095 RepID=A0A1G9YRN7_9FIRM|nr:MFS transporter [Megasphaera paucivorans]SDN11131.1 Sugar phosphate permease [Megasphaera paucivorans]
MSQVNAQSLSGTKKATKFRWFIISLIFLIYTVASADRSNLGVALPFLRQEFQMTNTEAGAIASLFSVGYALAQVPAGFMFSKLGVHKIFSWALIATSVFTGFMGTANSAFALKGLRLGLGLSEAALPVGITTTINNWFPAKEKGTASGIFLAGAKFGPVLVPLLSALIIANWGWRPIFYICAVPGIVFAIIWLIFVRNKPEESKYCNEVEQEYIKNENDITKESEEKSHAFSFGWLDTLIRSKKTAELDTTHQILTSWNVWGAAIGYFFIAGIVYVLYAWIPTYLVTVKHFSIMKMGFVASAPWIGAVIGNLLGGWISDRILAKRRKPMMIVTALTTAIMMYLMITSPNDSFYMGMLLLIAGIFLNLGYSAFMVYPMGLTSKEKYPIAMSIVNTGGQFGGAVAPLVVGFILDVFNWNTVFIFLSLCSLVTLIVLFTIVEPLTGDMTANKSNS